MLGVFGSPRRDGNSSTLLEELLRSAEKKEATVDRVVLADRKIAPCRSCNVRRAAGACAQHDGMETLVERLVASDVWVLATLVYWWGPSAQLKTFVDRWYGSWHNPKNRPAFRAKRAALAISMGDSNPATAHHVVGMFEDAFSYLGLSFAATVLAPNVSDPGDAAKRRERIDAARQTGRELVAGR